MGSRCLGESLHIEALAWFDLWLKEQDTGILDFRYIIYIIPEAEGWRTSDTWPIPEAPHHYYLCVAGRWFS